MIAVLIACGPNSIEVPCRIFENIEAGKQRCDEIFGVEGEVVTTQLDGKTVYYYEYRKYLEEEPREISKEMSDKLFTKHYYGCGGPGPFVLAEVEFNTKFVGFDLD